MLLATSADSQEGEIDAFIGADDVVVAGGVHGHGRPGNAGCCRYLQKITTILHERVLKKQLCVKR